MGGYPGDDYKGGQLFAKLDGAKRLQDFIVAESASRWQRKDLRDGFLLRRRYG